MLQSQILTSISSLILNNKDREISFKKWDYLFGEDTMTDSKRDIIEQKYVWFNAISWWYIYNWVYKNDELVFFNIFRKIFKRNFYTYRTFPYLQNRAKLDTIFKIQNNKEFIISFLQFIDSEKKTLHIKDKATSQKYILDKVKSSKGKLGTSKFPLSFTIKQYLWEAVLIYEELQNISDLYEIENIQIFNGNIIFSLSQIWEEEVVVTFQNDEVHINWKPIYFQGGNSFIKEYIHLLFSYLSKNNTNKVTLKNLEEYYIALHKEWIIYEKISLKKFNYYEIRRWIEWKSEKISEAYSLNKDFIGLNTMSIWCNYYIGD